MIFNINSTRGQMRFLTCVARVTCLVSLICIYHVGHIRKNISLLRFELVIYATRFSLSRLTHLGVRAGACFYKPYVYAYVCMFVCVSIHASIHA